VSDGALFVLDASALLALFHREKGWETVYDIVSRDDVTVTMSAINYAEVLSKSIARGKTPDIIIGAIRNLGIRVMDFNSALAEQTGVLKTQVVPWGLSLGDCACLVLARHLGATALTADTVWANLKDIFRLTLIR